MQRVVLILLIVIAVCLIYSVLAAEPTLKGMAWYATLSLIGACAGSVFASR